MIDLDRLFSLLRTHHVEFEYDHHGRLTSLGVARNK